MARSRVEQGQITAMLVLFALCLLLAVIAVTDTSAAYLRRQAAMSLADGAALAATDAAAAGAVYGSAQDDYVALDAASAAAAVDDYLDVTGAYDEYPGLAREVTVTGHTVTVDLSMPYALPVKVPGVDPVTSIEATGSAAMPIY